MRHDDGDAVVLDWPAMCARWGITGLGRRTSAFGLTDNFDIALRLDDGGAATVSKTVVPFYAGWPAARRERRRPARDLRVASAKSSG